MTALRIGDRVQVDAETEVLVLLAIDNDEAWLRDDLGQHQVRRIEDLAPAHSKAWHQSPWGARRRNNLVLDAMARVDLP
jgi:hypothetical protein